jgi:hypothetical protein
VLKGIKSKNPNEEMRRDIKEYTQKGMKFLQVQLKSNQSNQLIL